MSEPPVASLMLRPNLYSNRALSISTTKKQNLGPSTSLHSTLNAFNIKIFWSRFRHDTPLLVRSPVQQCLLRPIALHTTLDFLVKNTYLSHCPRKCLETIHYRLRQNLCNLQSSRRDKVIHLPILASGDQCLTAVIDQQVVFLKNPQIAVQV